MKKILISSMIAATLVAGCASTGNKVLKNETQATVGEKLTPGMLKADVQNIFGEPLDISYTDSGNEIWKYKFTKTKMKAKSFIPYYGILDNGSKGDAKTLVIFFDDDGKLVKHTMSTSKVDNDSGLLN